MLQKFWFVSLQPRVKFEGVSVFRSLRLPAFKIGNVVMRDNGLSTAGQNVMLRSYVGRMANSMQSSDSSGLVDGS